jgi:hypothetical protein
MLLPGSSWSSVNDKSYYFLVAFKDAHVRNSGWLSQAFGPVRNPLELFMFINCPIDWFRKWKKDGLFYFQYGLPCRFLSNLGHEPDSQDLLWITKSFVVTLSWLENSRVILGFHSFKSSLRRLGTLKFRKWDPQGRATEFFWKEKIILLYFRRSFTCSLQIGIRSGVIFIWRMYHR